jgi:uncharacterized protein YegL
MSSQSLIVDVDQMLDKQLETADMRRQAGVGGGLTDTSVKILKKIRVGTNNHLVNAGATGLQVVKTRNILHFILLMDASGSMYDKVRAIVSGMNEMVEELASPKNPEHNSIEMSIYLFRNNSVEPLNVNGQEILNMPVTSIPKINESDYVPSGSTPLNKAVLLASLAGSARATGLMHLQGRNRVASTTYLVVATDGLNTLTTETNGGQQVTYYDADVKKVVQDLLKTEAWIFALAYAGGGTAEKFAENLGFPLYRDIVTGDSSNSAHNWRSFFQFMSQKVMQASKKVLNGQSASQASGVSNTSASNVWS